MPENARQNAHQNACKNMRWNTNRINVTKYRATRLETGPGSVGSDFLKYEPDLYQFGSFNMADEIGSGQNSLDARPGT